MEPRPDRRRRGAGSRVAAVAAFRGVFRPGRDRRGACGIVRRYGDTDWTEIVGLYDLLQRIAPSPVVELNRSVALAMRDGVEAGLAEVDRLLNDGALDGYSLAHAARADFLRRLGRDADARKAYAKAIKLTAQGPARRFLEKRLAEAVRLTPESFSIATYAPPRIFRRCLSISACAVRPFDNPTSGPRRPP